MEVTQGQDLYLFLCLATEGRGQQYGFQTFFQKGDYGIYLQWCKSTKLIYIGERVAAEILTWKNDHFFGTAGSQAQTHTEEYI